MRVMRHTSNRRHDSVRHAPVMRHHRHADLLMLILYCQLQKEQAVGVLRNLGSQRQQHCDDIAVTVARCQVQGRVAHLVGGVYEVRVYLQQQLQRVRVAGAAGQVNRRVTVYVPVVSQFEQKQ